ncbi:Cpr47Eb [Drosophila busckii]|uniref:Cpr47Eb n=1 Tax=Drosophila busckii TaxID=30019 RepID=A0A0M4EGE9_DROBS|nr:larval cuticle protein LCP-17 [Drosophila busckii]ALC41472.1 Cpr47Eb [Drosophila busckii]
MFKFVVCLIALVGAASAASISPRDISVTTEKHEIVPLLSFLTDKEPNGNFRFMFEGGDKSFREETGTIENQGTEDETLEVSGSYRYIDADGQLVEVHYTAGKNGFVPTGTHILPEITALAKAAADLPNNTEELEQQNRRHARSKGEEKPQDVEIPIVEKQTMPQQAVEEPKQKQTVAKPAVEEAKPKQTVAKPAVEEPKPAASEIVPVKVLPVEKMEKTEKVATKSA